MKSSAVDYRHLARLVEEFNQLRTRLQGFYLDAAAGFGYVRTAVIDEQASARNAVRGSELDSEGFQDTRMFFYDEIFSKPFCTSGIHSLKQGEVKRRNEASGENLTTLGQLCIVSFHDFWNEYMRQEYVIEKGNLRRDEKDRSVKLESLRAHSSFDLWGDLYYFRTSIVHNKGISTSDMLEEENWTFG